jgi:hypothetical protein
MATDEFNVLSAVVGFLLRLGAAFLVFLAERGAYYGLLFI